MTFPNSSIDSKLGLLNLGLFFNSKRDWKLEFLNVAVAGPLNFSQFMKEIENWDFWLLA